MINLFAGPVYTQTTPDTTGIFVLVIGSIALIFLTLMYAISYIISRIVGFFSRRYYSKKPVGKFLASNRGARMLAVHIFVVSTLSTVLLIKKVWPYFDGIESDFVGNAYFSITVLLTSLLLSTLVFCISMKVFKFDKRK